MRADLRHAVNDLDNQVRTSLDAPLMATLRALASALPNLKRLDYSDAKGLSFADEHNWRVLFGQPDQTNAKLGMLRTLSTYLLAQKVDVEYIDVRLPERAYYKPK